MALEYRASELWFKLSVLNKFHITPVFICTVNKLTIIIFMTDLKSYR